MKTFAQLGTRPQMLQRIKIISDLGLTRDMAVAPGYINNRIPNTEGVASGLVGADHGGDGSTYYVNLSGGAVACYRLDEMTPLDQPA